MKVLTVIGARPQFVKAATVSAAIAKKSGLLTEIIVHTGQHFDHNMSGIFFEQMGIPEPAYQLDIHSLGHGAMTGRMLEELEKIMVDEKPDCVMVYGDTNSTLAGALAARKLNIPVAHVEAGLRSFDMSMPEEVNRILTDRISNLLFCPTKQAMNNLAVEGFEGFPCKIVLTGDVMLDAALTFGVKSVKPAADLPEKFIMATLHRQSNTDNLENLKSICLAIRHIADEVPVVLPIHPRTRAVIEREGLLWENQKVIVIDPVGYPESLWLIQNALMVMTDSGGLQKEAYFFGKACLTLRNETEWQELVETGTNIPAGVSTQHILKAYHQLKIIGFTPDLTLYGGGEAAQTIAEHLCMIKI
jgi:UDP-GlcNAc3NAcA epimerase